MMLKKTKQNNVILVIMGYIAALSGDSFFMPLLVAACYLGKYFDPLLLQMSHVCRNVPRGNTEE